MISNKHTRVSAQYVKMLTKSYYSRLKQANIKKIERELTLIKSRPLINFHANIPQYISQYIKTYAIVHELSPITMG